MKAHYLLPLAALAVALPSVAGSNSQPIDIGGKTYTLTTLERRDLGPSTTWQRLRLEEYPLNINVVTMDVTDPNNRVETFQGQDRVGSTEAITSAAARLDGPAHKPMAAANGNFWCVSGQPPWSDMLTGTTFGGNMRNGKIITETNNASDQWCGTPLQTCVIGSDDSRLWIEPLVWRGYVAHPACGYVDFEQVNKVVRPGEMGLYNGWYRDSQAFRPVEQYDSNGTWHWRLTPGDATEVYLDLADGEEWRSGADFKAVVAAVRTNAGDGTRGSHDMVFVARGDKAALMAGLTPGDTLTVNSSWTSFRTWETPRLTNVMQGLSLVIDEGEIVTEANQGNSYNNQVYPKTAYGTDRDNKVLYMLTIDKSTDPVWGASAGCPSWVMCAIMKHLGCWRAATVDAGGSTEMMVQGRIVNKTTESSPRPVANGWMVFDTAPDDATVARLAFDKLSLKVPVHATVTPALLAYNQYGSLLDGDPDGIELECAGEMGSCAGNTFTAGANAARGVLTARRGDVTATVPVEVVESDLVLDAHEIVIDHVRRYPIEVHAVVDGNPFVHDPAKLTWTVADNTVADIGADGTLTGISRGTTTITGSIGQYTDQATVSVEIPHDRTMPVAPQTTAADWKLTYTSAKNGTVTPGADGAVSLTFTVSSSRSPKVTMSAAEPLRIYGLPDRMEVIITRATATVSSLTLSLQGADMDRAATVSAVPAAQPDGSMKAVFDLADIHDTGDIKFYPVTFKSLAANLGGATGTYSIDFGGINAVYDNFVNAVQNIAVDTAVNAGPAQYYTLQGRRVAGPLPGQILLKVTGNTARKIVY